MTTQTTTDGKATDVTAIVREKYGEAARRVLTGARHRLLRHLAVRRRVRLRLRSGVREFYDADQIGGVPADALGASLGWAIPPRSPS